MFTIYSADYTGNPGNCFYPNKHTITDLESLRAAVAHDYVCAEYHNNYRNGENFIGTDCLPVDCDNDHSENPDEWVMPADVLEAFPGVTFAVHYSRSHMREKNGKAARPKFHILFPIDHMTDAVAYSNMKKLVKNFADHLYHNAGESILAWIIEGAKKVIDADYKVKLPVCVQKAIDEYRSQNDWFTHFLEDKCEVDPKYRISSSALYQAYRNYCQDTNEYVRSTTDFYYALEKAGFTKIAPKNKRFYLGLRLKPDDGDFEDFLQ